MTSYMLCLCKGECYRPQIKNVVQVCSRFWCIHIISGDMYKYMFDICTSPKLFIKYHVHQTSKTAADKPYPQIIPGLRAHQGLNLPPALHLNEDCVS